ncbi:MAG: glycine--tRNA ligase subunit beta, partial [Polyangiaceae bacterium]
LIVEGLVTEQPDLSETVMGPPVKVAFKDGVPTKAAEAFAKKIGTTVAALERVETEKGEYLRGVREQKGQPAGALLAEALASVTTSIPFRKSMRWGDGDLSFGRPVRWLLALFGDEVLPVSVGDIEAGRSTRGHRFLHPDPVEMTSPASYVDTLRGVRVYVDPQERAQLMATRLKEAADSAGLVLIEDEFLLGENLSLVEEPQVIVGTFEPRFLELPEQVILEVARGHQRYFGLRDTDGKLAPKYLAVVNTAENPAAIREGNDRVMRARLADAEFFYREDLKVPLGERRKELAGIVFQTRLGSVLDKVVRIEKLCASLGAALGLSAAIVERAVHGAALCKNDLVTWMVGEFPELQGQMGRAYALAQGTAEDIAGVISEHYRPKGAADAVAQDDAAALVAIADRLDTLVGCFSIGLAPTGGADPYGLRRACLGVLRTALERRFDIDLVAAFAHAYAGFDGVELDMDGEAVRGKLGLFFRDRARGLFSDALPIDAVDASLAVAASRPLDARARAAALAGLDAQTRSGLGEVFKRATNIAKSAPDGEPERGSEAAELALFDAFYASRESVAQHGSNADYAAAFAELAALAPVLGRYFDEVLVMADDEAVRARRLRLMRVISESCGGLARLELLGSAGDDTSAK